MAKSETYTTYTLTTEIPDHGFTRYETETLAIMADGQPILNGACITRGKAADRLKLWRSYERTCPDQTVDKVVYGNPSLRGSLRGSR